MNKLKNAVMKKILITLSAVLAAAGIAFGITAATVTPAVDLSNVKVEVYQGSAQLFAMSGTDCFTVYNVLPANVKTFLTDEWNKFNDVARTQGTYAGVKYSIKQDMTFSYNGYKVVASNLTPEMVQKIVDARK